MKAGCVGVVLCCLVLVGWKEEVFERESNLDWLLVRKDFTRLGEQMGLWDW